MIRYPVAEDLKLFEQMVQNHFSEEGTPMSEMLNYALSSRGKGVRPTLVLLSAALNSAVGSGGKRAALAGMLIEMIHVASLIHDDVIDDAETRRGKASLNARWQSRNAIVAGDYILARTMSIGMKSGQYDLVQHIIGAITTLCEGEVLQSRHATQMDTTRKDYLEIIYKKTASLLSISASAGALAAGASRERIDTMRRYGEAIGMAFQIQDDILDYTSLDGTTGKPSHNDLREGKITLPLIAVLEQADEAEQRRLLDLLARCKESEEAINELHEVVISRDGTLSAARTMHAYLSKAAALLADYESSPARDALINLCAFVGERDR